MAELPRANREFINGTPVNTNVAAPLDFSAIAQGVSRHEDMQDRLAAKRAEAAVRTADETYTAQYVPAAETYDGSAPGFAKAQGDAWDTETAKVRAGLDERALPYFEQAAANRRHERLSQAVEVEGRVLGGIQRGQQVAAQTARVATSAVGFQMATMDRLKADAQGETMLAPDYEQTVLADFDARSKAAIEALPETDKAAFQQQMTQQRANLQVDLHTQGFARREQRVKTDATTGLQAVTNRAFNDPSYLPQAMLDAQKVTEALPLNVRAEVQSRIPATVTAAAAEGFRSRNDYEGLKHFLATPGISDTMEAGSYQHYQGYVNSTAAQAAQAQQQELAQKGLENELATRTATGQSGGFDPNSLIKAYGPVQGPVMATKAAKALNDATGDYQLVHQASDLSTADFLARIDILKPKAGDADFADKQARYDRARSIGGQIAQARMSDPSGATAASTDGAPLWQAVQAGGPGAGQRWADFTLAKQAQWGVPEAQRRVLPAPVAKQMVTAIQKAAPDKRDDAMAATWAQLNAYGANGGRVLSELQQAGLGAPDAAMIHMSDGSPVMLGQYGRAQAVVAAATKFDKATNAAIGKAVDKAYDDFGATYAYSTDGQIFAGSLKQAITTMTQANIHDGMDYGEAARAAVKTVTGGYKVSRDGDYRMPVQYAADEKAIRTGTGVLVREYYTNRDRLWPQKLAGAPSLTDEQLRANYAGMLERAQFINANDDSGLMMVLPSPGGGMLPVLDKDGRPITRTWAQLTAAGKAYRAADYGMVK